MLIQNGRRLRILKPLTANSVVEMTHATASDYAGERKPAEMSDAADPQGATGATGAPPPAQPFATFTTQADLDTRLERAKRAGFREAFGTEKPEEIQAQLQRLKDLEAAEAERKRAELTETQKLQADLQAAQAAKSAAEAALANARFQTQVTAACVKHGIKNVEYAQFEVGRAGSPTGAPVDPDAYLAGLVAKPEYKAAFGIALEPVVAPAPVTTSPSPGDQAPPPPRAPSAPETVDVMKMSPQEFQRHIQGL
jgi:hypothetical protein